MKRLKFKCSFLSDVVLNAQTATEGTQVTLDYIPGSNFLGIVAKNYKGFEDKAYDVFHSGKVSFGDAHLSENDTKSYKSPLSWFIKKGTKITDKVWIHHALNQDQRNSLTEDGTQLKQVRSGWIGSGNKVLEAEKIFAIKSGYNRKERRSEDGKLYGYQSLKAGSDWVFYVDIDDSIDPKFIKDELCGEKSIGRSRSAQFGRVKVEYIETNNTSPVTVTPEKIDGKFYVLVYAESRLAFVNEFGQETYQPVANDFGVEGKVNWALSQVKSGSFAPWIGINKCRLKDRCYLEKGSVIAIEADSGSPVELKASGIGRYVNEGFGNVIFNPSFLASKDEGISTSSLIKDEVDNSSASKILFTQASDSSDGTIASWLKEQQKITKKEQDIYDAVTSFCSNEANLTAFARITSSQWGQVRACATTAETTEGLQNALFDKNSDEKSLSYVRSQDGLLRHGKTEKAWKSCYEILEKELTHKKDYGTEYAERLATQMQKIAKRKEKEAKSE